MPTWVRLSGSKRCATHTYSREGLGTRHTSVGGKLFKDGQAYLPEILISCRAMNRGVEELKPYLAGTNIYDKGTVVLGTVEGDLHDIGKNIVRMMLESRGFKSCWGLDKVLILWYKDSYHFAW